MWENQSGNYWSVHKWKHSCLTGPASYYPFSFSNFTWELWELSPTLKHLHHIKKASLHLRQAFLEIFLPPNPKEYWGLRIILGTLMYKGPSLIKADCTVQPAPFGSQPLCSVLFRKDCAVGPTKHLSLPLKTTLWHSSFTQSLKKNLIYGSWQISHELQNYLIQWLHFGFLSLKPPWVNLFLPVTIKSEEPNEQALCPVLGIDS